MERSAQRAARWAGGDLSCLTKPLSACTREDSRADSGAPGTDGSLGQEVRDPRAGRILPPPPPQSGAGAPQPRFRFPRRHLRHGHFSHRLHPVPLTAGHKREAAALRAALGQREVYLSPEEGRFCRCPPEVTAQFEQEVKGRRDGGARRRCPHLRWRRGGLFPPRRWRRRERRSGRVAGCAWLGEGSGMGPSPPETSPFTGRGRPRHGDLGPALLHHNEPPQPFSLSSPAPSPATAAPLRLAPALILGSSLPRCMRGHWVGVGWGHPLPVYPSTPRGSRCSILF